MYHPLPSHSAVASLKPEEKKKVGKDARGSGHQARKGPSFAVGPGTSALSGEGKEHPSLPSRASPAAAAGECNLHSCLMPSASSVSPAPSPDAAKSHKYD